MKIYIKNKTIVIVIVLIFALSNYLSVVGTNINLLQENDTNIKPLDKGDVQYKTLEFSFSSPDIVTDDENIWVYLQESDLNMMIPNKPILPVNITEIEFIFGTDIVSVDYAHSEPIIINISKRLSQASFPKTDIEHVKQSIKNNEKIAYEYEEPFPSDWIYYHVAGGLSFGEHVTFFINRVYPVRYYPLQNQLHFIQNISITISYREPAKPILEDNDVYDLLILTPKEFEKPLNKLVNHKNEFGVKTRMENFQEVYKRMYWYGGDNQEKIKYFIKNAIEYWGITYVLLVGGLKGQSLTWNTPVRYSYVVPPEEQEYAEVNFLSDIYYADVYDSKGNFSSWDSNSDDIFSVWNETFKEEMDLYPDVYLGRLACRNLNEVKIMVKKIIQYEQEKYNDKWFKNFLLIAGDSYNDTNHFNEGELISEQAIKVMPEFNPVKVYASETDINRRTVNMAMNKGAGFAYYCGHGNPASWTTHFPPDGSQWTTGYANKDMKFLLNKGKYPIAVVGGCHNGQFDVARSNLIKGILENGIYNYFRIKNPYGAFWKNEWVLNCWAWKLTSMKDRGAIACIANTGLGTHGEDDSDNNSIADYLEVLDGWLELRFFQLYGVDGHSYLGENHGQTLTEYLHRFLGNEEKMDVKMVQQWELFGDPSLKIGGYQ